MLIEARKLHIFKSVGISLSFIESHSCIIINNINPSVFSFIDLDKIQLLKICFPQGIFTGENCGDVLFMSLSCVRTLRSMNRFISNLE